MTKTTTPLKHRLSFKQARAAVLIALALGSLFAALQVRYDVKREIERINALGYTFTQAVRNSAARAAYRLDPVVAQEVVDGLLLDSGLFRAEIIDDFDDRLGLAEREVNTDGLAWIGLLVGSDPIETTLPLTVANVPAPVGSLTVFINPIEAAYGLPDRVIWIVLSGFGKSLLLAFFLLILFHKMITKRLSAVTERLFSRTDRALSSSGDEIDDLEAAGSMWRQDALALQENIRRNEARLKLAANAASLGIWDYDITKNTLYWDDRMFRIYDVEREHFSGRYEDWERRIHPEDLEMARSLVMDSMDEQQKLDTIFRIMTPSGETRYVKADATTLFDARGEAIRMIGVNRDVTDQVAAERELIAARNQAIAANQAKSDFLANMSHELRTPLNAILGYGQLLKLDGVSIKPEKREVYLDSILKGGEHLLALVNDILDLARVEAGKLSINQEVVAVNQLVADCLEQTYPLAQKRGIVIDDGITSFPTVLIETDSVRLRQILMNLLSNAVKFNVDHGHIEIRCSTADAGWFTITVKDTGIGISDDDRQRVFDAFERCVADPFLASDGAGIGLSVSQELAKRLGGSISFTSEIGTGTEFRLRLPWVGTIKVPADETDKPIEALATVH
ncbi:MAG: PAS domain-containing sensor histidine kinase [Alphaproteobacteria bacterium]|nr:PAS domain-containing sensor histidine kinase [Alphaproteobacteria bacterium]